MDSELLSTLSDIEKLVESFTAIENHDLLVEKIESHIQLIADFDRAELYLCDDEQTLKLFSSIGFSEKEKAEEKGMEILAAEVYRSGEFFWENNHSTEKSPIFYSKMVVPVKLNTEIIGVFGIQSKSPNAFSEKNLALLKVFASLIGDSFSLIKKGTEIKRQIDENEKLSILIRNTTNNVIYADKEGRITWVNKRFEESTGFLLDDIIGKKPGSFLCGEATEIEKTNELRTAIQQRKKCQLTITNYKKNGELFKVDLQLIPIFHSSGEFYQFVSIQEDITRLEVQKTEIEHNQKEIQGNLLKIAIKENLYSSLVQTTHDLISTIDKNGIITFVNNSWVSKMEYLPSEVIGTLLFNYIYPDSQEHCISIFNELTTQNINSTFVAYSLINRDGIKIDIEGMLICEHENNELVKVNSFFKDVTEVNKIKEENDRKEEEKKIFAVTLTEISLINFLEYDSFKSVLEYISSKASICLSSSFVFISRYSGNSILSENCYNAKTDEHFIGREVFENEYPLYFEGLKKLLYISSNDSHADLYIKDFTVAFLDPLGIKSTLNIPIKINNKLWGVICFANLDLKNDWTQEEISFAKAIGDCISNVSSSFKIRESSAKLERVLSSLTETVWGISLPDYKMEYISDAATQLYEVPIEEWYRNVNLWSDAIHPEDKEWVLKESENLFITGQTNLKYRIITPSNKIKWISSKTKIIKNESGIPILMTGISDDITSRKLTEQKLINYKEAIDESAIVSITDTKGIITYVNDKFCEISKYSREELIGQNHRIINSGFHSKDFFDNMWSTISSGNVWKGELKNKTKQGEEYFVESTIVPFMNEGKPFQYIAIRYESTEKVKSKSEIESQKVFYESILNNIPEDVAVFDKNGVFQYLNPSAVEDPVLRKWLIGKTNYDYCDYRGISKSFADARKLQYEEHFKAEKAKEFIEEKLLENGEIEYVKRQLFSFDYLDSRLTVSYGMDITEIKLNEKNIFNIKHFYEQIIDNIPIDIAVFDDKHQYVFVNKEAIRDEELRKWIVGKDDFDYAALKNLPTEFAQNRRDFFMKMLHSNGEYLWMDKQVNALGEVKYKERRFYTYDDKKFVIGYGVDVTVFKEQEILLSTSLEEKEALLGEVHHRVKNNLALVLGLIEMQQISTTDAIVTSQLSEIRNRITTMSLIHEKLYKSSNFAKIDLKDYLEDLVKFLSNYYNKGKEITLNFDLEQIFAITDKAIPIALIVNELITNSFKYAFEHKKDGIISIKLKEIEGEIHLIVSDNGPGLPDNLNLLKSDSLGYKLLSIFVRQIKGSYEYENNQGLSIKIKFKND